MLENKLISVVIPAYNNPEYTLKTLNSIYAQTYRPIEIILSDDCSPNSLDNIVENFKIKNDDKFIIKYFKQKNNLGYFYNLRFCLTKANGHYLIMLDHDDWLVDDEYFFETIKNISKRKNCFVGIGNTFFENVTGTYLNFFYNNWNYINGKHFLKYNLYKSINPCKSSIIMNLQKLREINYLQFLPDQNTLLDKKNSPDEGYILISLLLPHGDLAITGKVFSVRGSPTNSLSKKDFWLKNNNNKHFVPLYNLMKYYKTINFKDGMFVMLINILFRFSQSKINFNLLKHYKYSYKVFLIILISNFIFYIKYIYKLPFDIINFVKKKIIFILRLFQ